MAGRKLISVIIPAHNEAPNLRPLYKKLVKQAEESPYDFEFIFVDDGSTDGTQIVLDRIIRRDERVSSIEFARNFGKEAATSAGLHASRGDAAITLDADLQHPPEKLPDFLREWENGADVVVGIKSYGEKEGWFKKWSSARFYQIMDKIAHTKITPHASDFRLLDREAIDAFSRLTERNRITRGLIDWLGFKRAYVYFTADERLHGSRSYTIRKLIQLAVNSFTAYSLVPLKLAGYLGVFILATATPTGVVMYIERYLLGDPLGWEIRGTAMLAMLLVILVGIMLACLGLISLYIASIHAEVTNRPLYVVRRSEREIPEGMSAITIAERERVHA